jgi:hypothetical protein
MPRQIAGSGRDFDQRQHPGCFEGTCARLAQRKAGGIRCRAFDIAWSRQFVICNRQHNDIGIIFELLDDIGRRNGRVVRCAVRNRAGK